MMKMKVKAWPVILVILLLLTGSIALASGRLGAMLFGPSPVELAEQSGDINEPFPEPKVPSSSQTGEPLPWSGDTRFEAAKQANQTPLLLAAYRATLADPILSEAYNIGLAADLLAGTVVKPGRVFSQNGRIGPYSAGRGFREGPYYSGGRIRSSIGGGVCKIASLLYNVVTLSNLQVVERHPHSMTVPYVPPGQDATVSYGVYDFKFKNQSNGPVLIWSDMVENTLYMALYGQQKPPRVAWHHETLKRSKFWTESRYNPSLPPGTEKVLMPGQEGIIVRSWLTVEEGDGQVVRRDLGKNYYRASPRVIERGPR